MVMTMRYALAVIMTTLVAAPRAHADGIDVGYRVQSDVRVRPEQLSAGTWYDRRVLPVGVSRNQNLFKLRLRGEVERVVAVAEVDFLWLGTTDQIQQFGDLFLRERIDPYRLKAHAAYAEIHDFLVPGLDLRVGQQVVNWGKGDQFNPTNTLNANDFEDPLLFGQQLANSMIRADYAVTDQFSLSAVLVPVFKPALLPTSAEIALADLRRMPIMEAGLRRQLLYQQQAALDLADYGTAVSAVTPEMPSLALDNMQAAVRAATTIADHDIAVSYYYGRSDMPQASRNDTVQADGPACDPAHPTACIKGTLQTAVQLQYPRMQVLGLNAAGEMPLLAALGDDVAPFGYHLELGVFLPHQNTLRLFNGPLLGVRPAGEYPYDLGGAAPLTLASTPFAKWNLGLDYTLPGGVYVNVQWLHGFVDEFGAGDFISPGEVSVLGTVDASSTCGNADQCVTEVLRPRLGDYLVIGADTRWFGDRLLTRLFVVYDLTGTVTESWDPRARRRVRTPHSPFSPDAASAVLFPEITYNTGGGLELSIGALAKLGGEVTKFGDPAAGGTDVWARARYTY